MVVVVIGYSTCVVNVIWCELYKLKLGHHRQHSVITTPPTSSTLNFNCQQTSSMPWLPFFTLPHRLYTINRTPTIDSLRESSNECFSFILRLLLLYHCPCVGDTNTHHTRQMLCVELRRFWNIYLYIVRGIAKQTTPTHCIIWYIGRPGKLFTKLPRVESVINMSLAIIWRSRIWWVAKLQMHFFIYLHIIREIWFIGHLFVSTKRTNASASIVTHISITHCCTNVQTVYQITPTRIPGNILEQILRFAVNYIY